MLNVAILYFIALMAIVWTPEVRAERRRANDSVELRHPKNDGFYWKRNKRTWVRFFWKRNGSKAMRQTLQVSRSKNFSDVIYEKQLNDAPHIWETKLTGWMYWRVVEKENSGLISSSTSHRRFKIIPEVGEPAKFGMILYPMDKLKT